MIPTGVVCESPRLLEGHSDAERRAYRESIRGLAWPPDVGKPPPQGWHPLGSSPAARNDMKVEYGLPRPASSRHPGARRGPGTGWIQESLRSPLDSGPVSSARQALRRNDNAAIRCPRCTGRWAAAPQGKRGQPVGGGSRTAPYHRSPRPDSTRSVRTMVNRPAEGLILVAPRR